MPDVRIVLHTRTPRQPAHATIGTTPSPDCPLAVTPAAVFDHDTDKWRPHQLGGFYITHRVTGLQLGSHRFDSVDEALAVIERCDWRFGAWSAATGGATDPATLACKAKWRAACPEWRD